MLQDHPNKALRFTASLMYSHLFYIMSKFKQIKYRLNTLQHTYTQGGLKISHFQFTISIQQFKQK